MRQDAVRADESDQSASEYVSSAGRISAWVADDCLDIPRGLPSHGDNYR